MNDLIERAVRKAQIPAVKEPVGLTREDGKRPDGATQSLIPWAQSKPLTYHVTVPDIFAPSRRSNTSLTAGAAADKAVVSKTAKYEKLRGTHFFFPVAIETGGPWNAQATELVQEIGRRLTIVTSDPLETQYLFHRISIITQRGNAVALHNTFPTERSCSKFT